MTIQMIVMRRPEMRIYLIVKMEKVDKANDEIEK